MSAASRDLDVVEFFSWQGNLRRACCKAGLAAVGYDYQRDPEQNIFLCMAGLARAISLLLPLTPNGLARFAPQRSSWVFLAHSGHGRTSANNYEGRAPPLSRSHGRQQQSLHRERFAAAGCGQRCSCGCGTAG